MTYSDIHLPLAGFIALDWSLMALALVPILIRISLRSRTHSIEGRASNIADAFVLLAWLSGCVLISINTWKNTLRMQYLSAPASTLYYGVPKHLSGHLLYVSWISLFFIYISLWSAKAAFLAFYYSIFSLQGRRTRVALLAACIFTLATFLLHMFLIAFWCSPVSANWSPVPDKGLCSAVHSMSSVTISTFTNIATDLVILSIPISTLAKARLGTSERAGLVFVFAMGSVSVLAAIVRFVTLRLVQSTPRASITHTIDVWALVEIVSSILAVCLPSLRRFVRKHRLPAGHAKLVRRASNETGMSASLVECRADLERAESKEAEKDAGKPRVEELWFDIREKKDDGSRDELWLQVPQKAAVGSAR